MSKLIDLTGRKFNEWEVISKATPSSDGRTRWNCRCSCGKLGVVGGYDLKNSKHKSCGHDRMHTIIDIVGKTFGELTVLEYDTAGKWKCKCTCGKELVVRGNDLKTGHSKSCGHNGGVLIGLTGQTFGEWKVIRYLGNSMWKCKCSCGTIASIHSYAIRNDKSKSCGCKIESRYLENLEGKQFNEWKVLKYAGNSKWKCQCTCGETGIVGAYDLKNGKSKNCGHNRKTPYNDLTGQIFGKLKVLTYNRKNIYTCECDCGNLTEVQGCNLISGGTTSCGCGKQSIYTKEFMEKILLEYQELTGSKPFTVDIAEMLSITTYYVDKIIKGYGLIELVQNIQGSKYEKELYDIVRSILGQEEKILTKDRLMLDNLELDIYIPRLKLAIEFNGTYWHSHIFKDTMYHQRKTIACAKQGIRLIHIFEYEWLNTETKIKLISMLEKLIETQTSNSHRLYARKCVVEHLKLADEQKFINNWHLQNYTQSKIAYGLCINNELVSVMTFAKPRFNSKCEWELIRYCVKDTVEILGGAEKLFKAFIGEYNPTSIVSYCDISKFTGNVYQKLGFTASQESITQPNYKWVKNGKDILSRNQTQKEKLIEQGYGKYGETEYEIMTNLGYIKVCDSGNIRFIWKNN